MREMQVEKEQQNGSVTVPESSFDLLRNFSTGFSTDKAKLVDF